jgi:MFS family permease
VDSARKNVAVLAGCQGLLHTNNAILISINALAGFALATDKALATLPVTMYFVGSALTTVPLSLYMKHTSRRAGFTAGAASAVLGALLCAWAIHVRDFWLLCAGVMVLGIYSAAGRLYRFAAADAAPPDFKSQAISLVLAGGVIGGFLGPETSKLTKDVVTGHPYAGTYLSLIGFAVITMLVLRWLEIPRLTEAQRGDPGRPMAVIARQPAFIVAILAGTLGYGVMNLLMTATPLAMAACQHPFSDAAFVIQWHVVAMFAPSFVTGTLIQRFGLLPIMLAGVALEGLCVVVALAGVDVMNFWVALVLVGVGWNFIFVGATTLLTETHTPAERAKVQGINELAILCTLVASSLSSGVLFSYQGWEGMNFGALPCLVAAAAGILWLAWLRRQPRAA